eukprot:1152925-Pelagomonas_calceolata.AAC.3
MERLSTVVEIRLVVSAPSGTCHLHLLSAGIFTAFKAEGEANKETFRLFPSYAGLRAKGRCCNPHA